MCDGGAGTRGLPARSPAGAGGCRSTGRDPRRPPKSEVPALREIRREQEVADLRRRRKHSRAPCVKSGGSRRVQIGNGGVGRNLRH
jgi:hypothetical protein